ncbi:hypothetical protein [Herbaspirillum sp. BH-1]|uniref:hypothetical protein n=1 Tax=Herbaspirillum sp. (strain BH-1) TaxID=2058884 RepID=UPI001E577FAA|nr:hypothetical protein [Herbaspirillum sp. BH-1]
MGAVLLLASSATVTAAGLPIGFVALTLGMDQADVLKKLKSEYSIISVRGNQDLFYVTDKPKPNGTIIGSVKFSQGKLATIDRWWGAFGEESSNVDLMRTFYAAIESSKSVAGPYVSIDTSTQRIPGAEYKTIKFIFLGRSVTLGGTDGKNELGGKQVTVVESVFSDN